MTTAEDKAQEIERAMSDRKDADLAMNDKLDKILTGFDDLNKRVDAMEGARKDGERNGEVEIEARERKDSESGFENLDKARVAMRGESAELAKAQARADSVSQMFGFQAPRPMDGEKPLAYRIRLLQHHQHNSTEFKDVDLKNVTDPATFDAIESRIYADSIKASATPSVPEGTLYEVKTRDESGRNISKFHGQPRSWMRQFMSEPQVVERINKHHD